MRKTMAWPRVTTFPYDLLTHRLMQGGLTSSHLWPFTSVKTLTCTKGFPHWRNSCLIPALPWQERPRFRIAEIQSGGAGDEISPCTHPSGFLTWEVPHCLSVTRRAWDPSSSLFLPNVTAMSLLISAQAGIKQNTDAKSSHVKSLNTGSR